MSADRPNLTKLLLVGAGAITIGWGALAAQESLNISAATASVAGFGSTEDARQSLERAQATAEFAQQRAVKFSQEASLATAEIDRLAKESAALAAQIQQGEADILAASAQLAILADQRAVLDARLAKRQQPLVRLTAAIQNMARRPIVLSALQPGSLRDTVYVRAVLETTLPQIREQTASLHSEVEQGRALESEAARSLAELQASETDLQNRRNELAALMRQQQEASRSNSALARREAQRALALAEQARDLDQLVGELDRAGLVREELATLAGPIMRPARPGASRVMPTTNATPRAQETSPPAQFQLPVHGRTITGFGEEGDAGIRSNGITIAPASGAQIVAPALGRVSFAGVYRGFGRIVIIEHENGWTSLITGLAQTSVNTGVQVIGGAPIGTAALRQPEISFELRERGEPINPLSLL